jgi:hypothetical protein
MFTEIMSVVLFVAVVYGGYRALKWYDNRDQGE